MKHHPTQQKILDETIRIIEASGEASVRVHDIEVAVGVTAPSIYHFFGSREGLVVAAQAERLLRSLDDFNDMSVVILSRVSNRAELREAVSEILALIYEPSRSVSRQQRIFALGSAEGRPDLAVAIGEAARSFLIRQDLDLEAFMQWLAGQILGRIYIEIGREPEAHPAWDAISQDAVAFVVFGSLSDD